MLYINPSFSHTFGQLCNKLAGLRNRIIVNKKPTKIMSSLVKIPQTIPLENVGEIQVIVTLPWLLPKMLQQIHRTRVCQHFLKSRRVGSQRSLEGRVKVTNDDPSKCSRYPLHPKVVLHICTIDYFQFRL